MIPIVFDGCFGWFHPAETSHAVVLCGPVGEEADYVYSSWREFAERLAEAGFSVLRFDYPGLCNSLDLGEKLDPPTAWVESIKTAVGWLKTEAGAEDVTLIGLRFGAGLALRCAEELGGVGTLVLLAPVVSGVAYQRELALLAKLSEERTAVGSRETLHQPATLFTAERTFDVESLHWGRGDATPAERIMILSEGVSSGGRALGEKLRTLGAEVSDHPFEGYSELMVRPELARYPAAAFGRVRDWLGETVLPARDRPGLTRNRRTLEEAELFPLDAHEVVVQLHEARTLVGIQCLPDTPREGRPGVIFLNTGAVPIGGMNRMWVSMARRLAALGFTSLRFDVNGVGESLSTPMTTPTIPRIENASIDVAAAISNLERKGCSTITLIGFCWGAQLAYNVALADDRVRNLIMINAARNFWDPAADDESVQTFSTHLRLLRAPAKWKSLKGGDISVWKLARFAQHLIWAGVKAGVGRAVGADTTRKRTMRNMRTLKARGTETFFVHGAEDTFLAEFEDYFAAPRQAFEPLLDIHTHYIAGVSHRFPSEKSLAELMRTVAEHLLDLAQGVTSDSMADEAATIA